MTKGKKIISDPLQNQLNPKNVTPGNPQEFCEGHHSYTRKKKCVCE